MFSDRGYFRRLSTLAAAALTSTFFVTIAGSFPPLYLISHKDLGEEEDEVQPDKLTVQE